MERKDFIKKCGLACMGAGTFTLFMQSCLGSKMVTGQITGDAMRIPLADFEVIKNKEKSFLNFVVIQNDLLKYPICVYRFSDTEYIALYMMCTHQGTELTAYGDKLQCSAHGSEFDNKGNVQGSPADKPLRQFPVQIENQFLIISLKAV